MASPLPLMNIVHLVRSTAPTGPKVNCQERYIRTERTGKEINNFLVLDLKFLTTLFRCLWFLITTKLHFQLKIIPPPFSPLY